MPSTVPYEQLQKLFHVVFQPGYFPELHQPIPSFVQLEVTITVRLQVVRHDCVSNTFIGNESARVSHETARFNLHLLNDRDRASEILVPMLTRLRVVPNSSTFHRVIDKIISYGLNIEKRECNRGRKLLPLHAEIWGRIIQHVNFEHDLVRRALEESALEFERSNHGMVPANRSSVKKMLKRVRVAEANSEEEEEECKSGQESMKKRRVSGKKCVICLEELEVGSYASLMPCSHSFHGNCIEKWLNQSHYCPVCRFEMPI